MKSDLNFFVVAVVVVAVEGGREFIYLFYLLIPFFSLHDVLIVLEKKKIIKNKKYLGEFVSLSVSFRGLFFS